MTVDAIGTRAIKELNDQGVHIYEITTYNLLPEGSMSPEEAAIYNFVRNSKTREIELPAHTSEAIELCNEGCCSFRRSR